MLGDKRGQKLCRWAKSRYSECSKILNTFLFSNKMLVWGWNSQNDCQIANREDRDQKQSDLGLCCLSGPFLQATSV